MQTPKKSLSRMEVPQRVSPVNSNMTGSESDSATSTCPNSTTPTKKASKAVDRKSPRSPTERKRPSRASELESQLSQLQEDLKRTRDQLAASEIGKRKAQQETEEAKKQLMIVTAKLEDTENQLQELSESEDDRIHELRKIGQERDRAWQSELEAVQKQHKLHTNTLISAMNEIQRLRLQLEMVVSSEAAQVERAEAADVELHLLKQDMLETLSLVETLRGQLNEFKKSEVEYQELVDEKNMQLEIAKDAIAKLQSDGMKAIVSLKSISLELEESKARVCSLEDIARNLPPEDAVKVESKNHEGTSELSFLQSKAEEWRLALEESEMSYQEEMIKSTMQIQVAIEALDRMKIEGEVREAELEFALKEAKAQIAELNAVLSEKDVQLQSLYDLNERLDAEKTKCQDSTEENKLDSELKKLMEDVMDLKATLMDKETELQIISEANGLLKSKIERIETEEVPMHQSENKKLMQEFMDLKATLMDKETELQIISEENDVLKSKMIERTAAEEVHAGIGIDAKEADENTMKTSLLSEQLEAVQLANSELEVELRRLKIQSEQWRKAAETATAILMTEDNGRMMERNGSFDSDHHAVAGKLMDLPFSDDADNESQKRRNSMRKKIGVLWKKGQK